MAGNTIQRKRYTNTIKLNLADETQIFDPFSISPKGFLSISGTAADENLRINNEIIEYLKREIEYIPIINNLSIEIEMPPQKTEILKQLINKKLRREIDNLLKENKRKKRTAGILTFFGLAVFSIYTIVPYFRDRAALNELFVIMSWVLIWRAVELFFFERAGNNLKRRRLLQIYSADYKRKNP
ncbi:hypothetical protein [Breznakiella homolactica]|uniref:Uncharacterized protein n=1 Tax=Breznakiella homolactica TaxID=2798577 RepID=A0A7T7XPD6_9SPIR|nr:hypothetical protein [Breznakiella homolactica]QQO10028.1 hypothetical protein JFL75_03690 [Breznakiella homolactica]